MNDEIISLFIKLAAQFDVELSDHQIQQFNSYYDSLIEWNSFVNLTAITEANDVMIKHFLDSIAIMKYVSIPAQASIIDIGTGAGFPGIPLKIILPDSKIVLLDSLNKRINFLNHIIDKLQLKNISTIHGRAEDLAHESEYREKFDFAVSRAVANLSTLNELCTPFVKVNGIFLSYKSEKADTEIDAAKNSFSKLGISITDKIEYTLPSTDFCRNLIVIHKDKHTFSTYPRKAGTPAKNPL